MARSSYRIKRWLRNAKDWRDYLLYRNQIQGGGDKPPPVIPISLRLSANNDLLPGFVTNRPEWFQEGEDFTLALSGGVTISFVWNVDRWTSAGTFPTPTGNGTITQGVNTFPAVYTNAEYPANFITAELGVRITGTGGIYITWS